MLVHIENLVKRYGDLLALDHLSLDIEEGEIFGLLGPNGSGKTTAINCLLALLKYDKGTITIFGKDMKPDSYDIKQDIGVVMQNVAVFEQMSVYENIDYFCGLYLAAGRHHPCLRRIGFNSVPLALFSGCPQVWYREKCRQRRNGQQYCGICHGHSDLSSLWYWRNKK